MGTDTDAEHQQREAVRAFAKRVGFRWGDGYHDAAGADPIEGCRGSARLPDRLEGNGFHTVVVEDASRFAREIRGAGATVSGDDLNDSEAKALAEIVRYLDRDGA